MDRGVARKVVVGTPSPMHGAYLVTSLDFSLNHFIRHDRHRLASYPSRVEKLPTEAAEPSLRPLSNFHPPSRSRPFARFLALHFARGGVMRRFGASASADRERLHDGKPEHA